MNENKDYIFLLKHLGTSQRYLYDTYGSQMLSNEFSGVKAHLARLTELARSVSHQAPDKFLSEETAQALIPKVQAIIRLHDACMLEFKDVTHETERVIAGFRKAMRTRRANLVRLQLFLESK